MNRKEREVLDAAIKLGMADLERARAKGDRDLTVIRLEIHNHAVDRLMGELSWRVSELQRYNAEKARGRGA